MNEQNNEFVDKGLKRHLWFFIIMFLVFITLAIIHFIQDKVPVRYPFIAFITGIVLGAILSRIQNITWDSKGHKIVKQFDIVGGILLILFILFTVFKKKIVYEITDLNHISAIVLSLNAGIMLGRVITIGKKILEIITNKELQKG
ncbi:MAG: hypothetical protein ABFR05_07155 [Bacteroidota bacterium]